MSRSPCVVFLLFCTLYSFSSSTDSLCVCSAPIRSTAASGVAVIFVCIGLVCTKSTGFLFVFLRRESRTRYEYFCEEELERYVADRGRAIQKRLGGAQRSTPVCARSARRVVVPLVGASELALLFLPQPFFAGPHRDLCPRDKA